MSCALCLVSGVAAVGSFGSYVDAISILEGKQQQKRLYNKSDELKTRLVVATSLAMMPTQSRLSANETTPHLDR